MAVIGTGNHPKAQWPGILTWFGRQYNKHPKECEFLFDYRKSSKSREEISEVTGFSIPANKTEGGRTTYDTETQGKTAIALHSAYSLGFITTREELDDNLYPVVGKQRSTALAFSMHTGREIVAANVYNRAGNTAFDYGDSGVSLLSTSHSTANGSQSNTLAVAADLSEASLEDLLIQIGNAKNSRGLQIAVMPKCLIVPVNESFNATRILESQLRVGTANNDVNAIKQMGAIPEGVKVSHYITDTDAFFIRTNVPDGMVGLNRVALELTRDNDFDTDNAKTKAYERFSHVVGDFRALYGSMGG